MARRRVPGQPATYAYAYPYFYANFDPHAHAQRYEASLVPYAYCYTYAHTFISFPHFYRRLDLWRRGSHHRHRFLRRHRANLGIRSCNDATLISHKE